MSEAFDGAGTEAPVQKTSMPTLRQPRLPLLARLDEQHDDHRQATWLELFFDLCFVVAVAALARAFHADPTWDGALIYAGLFLPVWWAWMGYAWFANTFDNDDVAYRIAVFGAMLGIVALATGVEKAALGDTTAYVLAYIALRAIMLTLLLRARIEAPGHEPEAKGVVAGFANRYLIFNAIGLTLWVVSLGFDDGARYAIWAVALMIEIYAPYAAVRPLWREPKLSALGQRLFHFDHIRERYGLFTIIVLGESVLAVSIGVSEVGWDATSLLAGGFSFAVAASIWWSYFDRTGRDALGTSAQRAFIWGYGHYMIFAAIAAVGVGTELLIEAAGTGPELLAATEGGAELVGEGGPDAGAAIFAGGVATFLAALTLINLANLGFRLTSTSWTMIAGRALVATVLILLAAFADPSPLLFTAVAAALMVSLNAFETRAVMHLQRARAGG